MDLSEQIFKRKSCRRYLNEEIDLAPIHEFIQTVEPLIPGINYNYKILTKKEVSLKTNWSASYYLALYSEKKENYGINIGFIFQQVSLFLQSIDIGSCWVGLGSPKEKNHEFVILIAFGKSDAMTRDINEFKRKKLSEIADINDARLKPVQYAPSAVNSQPWYFKKSEDGFDAYKIKHNIVKRKLLGKLNDIDIGIALSHLYVTNKDTFKFEIKNKKDIKGYTYIGTVKI